MVVEAKAASFEVIMARKIYELDLEADRLNAELRQAKSSRADSVQKLLTYLSDEGKNSTGHIDGVGTFTIRREVYPSVTKADLPTFIEYLREKGEAGIVKETIAEPTLKVYLKGKISDMHEWLLDDDAHITAVENELNLPGGEFAPADLAAKYFERYGVKVFNKVGLSITKRGK